MSPKSEEHSSENTLKSTTLKVNSQVKSSIKSLSEHSTVKTVLVNKSLKMRKAFKVVNTFLRTFEITLMNNIG